MHAKNFSLIAFALTMDKALRVSADKAEDRAEAKAIHADVYTLDTPEADYSEPLALELDKGAERASITAERKRELNVAHRKAVDADVFAKPTNGDIRRKLHELRVKTWEFTGKERKAAVAELRIIARRELKAAMIAAAEKAAENEPVKS